MAPATAKQARLLRLANRLGSQGVAGVPKTETERLLWARSHAEWDRQAFLADEEETLRAKMLPRVFGANNLQQGSAHGTALFHLREYPMFPGEYIPPEQNTLASIRDELKSDLTAQNLKHAWHKVQGAHFESSEELYARSEGLDDTQIGEVVAALFPFLGIDDARALVRRTVESLSRPDSTPSRQLNNTVSAEALGLDNTPGHYTNFLEWIGRVMDTKAFQTEHALYQFCRRRFNREDVRVMWENYKLFSKESLALAQSDSYSHFFEVLKDYKSKLYARDTRPQKGVRIDPQEVDPDTGIAVGFGSFMKIDTVCWMRENRDATGLMTAQGKPIHEVCADAAWNMEELLWPFDEAGLNVREFDVYIDTTRNFVAPTIGQLEWCQSARLAIANAIAKMIPPCRVPLKKAGLLTVDKRLPIEGHPGRLPSANTGENTVARPYYKRA